VDPEWLVEARGGCDTCDYEEGGRLPLPPEERYAYGEGTRPSSYNFFRLKCRVLVNSDQNKRVSRCISITVSLPSSSKMTVICMGH